MGKPVVILQHEENDCGVACMAMICRHFGAKVSMAHIRGLAKTDRNGNSLYSLMVAAEELGLEAEAFEAEIKDMYGEDFTTPAIVHTRVDDVLEHYMVVFRVEKDYILVGDPAVGLVKYTPEEFEHIWTGYVLLFVKTDAFEQTKELKEENNFHIFAPVKSGLIKLTILSLVIAALCMICSYFYSVMVDIFIPEMNTKTMGLAALATVGVFLLVCVLNLVESKAIIKMNRILDKELVLKTFEHMLKLPMEYFLSRTQGEMLSKFQEIDYSKMVLYESLITFFVDVLIGICAIVILGVMNPLVLPVVLVIMAITIVYICIGSKKLAILTRKKINRHANALSFIGQTFRGVETIKGNLFEKEFLKRMKYVYGKYQDDEYTAYKESNVQTSVVGFLLRTGTIVALFVCGAAVINDVITLGALMMSYVLIDYAFSPVQRFIELQVTIQDTSISIQRLKDVVNTNAEATDFSNKEIDDIRKIELKDVMFQYGMRDPVLNNLNLSIEKGETVGIVGISGSGKTTLSKLLMGFYSPSEGELCYNGRDIHEYDIESIRKRTAYVSQNDYWFNDSLYNNLAGDNNNLSEEQIMKMLEIVGMEKVVENNPFGVDMMIEEGGMNLSSGEKQRLSIVRALLKQPDILLMDEGTSNLDMISEDKVIHAIKESEIPIKIIIAHRLHTLINCDKILVLESGRIAEEGSKEELLAIKDGIFKKLWESQEHRK